MKSLTHSLPAKVASVFLLIVLSVTLLGSALGVTFAYANNLYQEYTPFFYDTQLCEDITRSYASQIASNYLDGVLGSEPYYDWYYAQDNCNLGFRILDSQGNVLAKNYIPQDIGYQQTVEFSSFSVECMVTSPIEAKDQYYLYYHLYELINPIRYQLIALLVISVIAFFADLVFLCCAAGHRKTTDELVLNFQDKIPLDLYLVAMGTAIFLAVQACAEFTYNAYDLFLSVILLLFVAAPIIFALGLAVFMTCVTRLKVGRWWKNTIVYRAWIFVLTALRWIGRGVVGMMRAIPMVWRTLGIVCAFELVNLMISLNMPYSSGAVLLWFIWQGMAALGIGLCVFQMKKLKEVGQRMSRGNFDQKVDTKKMLFDFKEHGNDLNSIGDGMAIAVEQRMRSERLKTELITNVSHDIKTPLTSIINYVDLLQKDHSKEQETEYLAILQRQSQRLKKLTEDLVEASKASTGNLTVSLVPTNIGELISQALGEYLEKMESGKLEPVVTLPHEELPVLADGKLLWRVLDNLFNNVCKYALAGTRVYIEVKQTAQKTVVSVKNISREPLNVEAEELMERFVRGDSSRHTEGSGLGLNIARSLVELQKGDFRLHVDGDLFKAEILLDNEFPFDNETLA